MGTSAFAAGISIRIRPVRNGVGGPAFETVDVQVAISVCRGDVDPRRPAFRLDEVAERRIHERFSYSRATLYAEARYGVPERRARELIEADLDLRRLPLIDGAFCDGRIGRSKVLPLVKVVVPEHEEAWLERAPTCDVKGLRREIARSKKGRAPRKAGDNRGLDPLGQRYLAVLGARGAPMSLALLARTLGVTEDTLARFVEPHLFHQALVRVTAHGRVAA